MNASSKLLCWVIILLTVSCVTVKPSGVTDIVIRNFEGAYGEEVREAIESQMFRMRDQFRIIARDEGSLAAVQQEAVKGKNRDDLFTKEGAGVKLRQGLAGAKVLHGTCHETKNKHVKKVLGGWLFGAYYPNEFEIDHKLYCTFRLINAENHVQELAGDSEPVEWTSEAEDIKPDPSKVRLLASEVISNIQKMLKE